MSTLLSYVFTDIGVIQETVIRDIRSEMIGDIRTPGVIRENVLTLIDSFLDHFFMMNTGRKTFHWSVIQFTEYLDTVIVTNDTTPEFRPGNLYLVTASVDLKLDNLPAYRSQWTNVVLCAYGEGFIDHLDEKHDDAAIYRMCLDDAMSWAYNNNLLSDREIEEGHYT